MTATHDQEARAWQMLCQRLQRDPDASEETDTCSLRAAWKAMLAFAAEREAILRGDAFAMGESVGRIKAEARVREACAKVAERHDTGDGTREDMEARRIAAAIRENARGRP